MSLAELLKAATPGPLSADDLALLKQAASLDTGGCTEHSCMYHGETNQARALLLRYGTLSALSAGNGENSARPEVGGASGGSR